MGDLELGRHENFTGLGLQLGINQSDAEQHCCK